VGRIEKSEKKPSKFQLKAKKIEKNKQIVDKFKKAEFLDVRGPHWTLSGAACLRLLL